MKRNLLKQMFAALLLLCATVASAHDFEVGGIYYNILSEEDKTVEVTYKGSYYGSYSNEYTGSVVIPEGVTYNSTTYSVTSIGASAFYYCTGLTSVEIPNSVTSIGGEAFYNCSGLTSVVIPNSVTSIGNYAFDRCTGLEKVYISDLSAWCNIDFASSDANPLYYAKNLYLNGELVTELVIPEGVKEIKKYAFYKCTGLTSIEIPNSVTSIGYEAFYNCSALTCIVIPGSVTSIGNEAFEGCSGLTSVKIPGSVTSIGNSAFEGCAGLTSIVVADDNAVYDSRNNCNAIIETSTDNLKFGCKNTVIPGSVKSIGVRAFSCTGLENVTIPSSIKTIGNYAFYDCDGLVGITIPSSVTAIGDYAFAYCTNLTDITINGFINNLKTNIVYGTPIYNTTEKDLYIDKYYFGFKDWDSYYGNVDIKPGTKYIMDLGSDNSIYNINIPSSVEYINIGAVKGGYYDGCPDCEDYSWVYYPNGYNVDANNAHYSSINGVLYNKDQTELLQVPYGYYGTLTIPASVEKIRDGAIRSRVTKLECLATTPPVWKYDGFNNVIYVPLESVDDYLSATDNWKNQLLQPITSCYSNEVVLYGCSKPEWKISGNSNSFTTFTKEYYFTAKTGEKISFDYSLDLYDAYFNISVNNKVFETVYNDVDNATFEYYILQNGQYTLKLEYCPYDAYYDNILVSNVSLTRSVYKNKIVELGNWTSPVTNHNSSSSKSYSFTADAGATIVFDWATSSESGYDKLICTLDGTTILTQSGVGNSGTYTGTVPSAGSHTLVLKYSKDGSVSNGDDRVSVNNIMVNTNVDNYDTIESYEIDENGTANMQLYSQFNVEKFTYKRRFNDTEWQSWYAPFVLPYNTVAEELEIAIPNDVHQYDDNNDGVYDRTELEAIMVKDGDLMSNFPYLVKAQEDGEMVIELSNITLPPSVENCYDISSLSTKYYLNGTYTGIMNSQMAGKDYYVVKNGALECCSDTDSDLSPNRWYMNVVNNNSSNATRQRCISITILDKGTTDIEEFVSDKTEENLYYDLSGRRVVQPGKGIYIVNGKIVSIK